MLGAEPQHQKTQEPKQVLFRSVVGYKLDVWSQVPEDHYSEFTWKYKTRHVKFENLKTETKAWFKMAVERFSLVRHPDERRCLRPCGEDF